MGQQQLLLIILGTAVVGIAVVAGAHAFGERSAAADRQAAIDGAVSIVASAQGWKAIPGALGGGAGRPAGDFSGISFRALGYETSAVGLYVSPSGCYELSGGPSGATLDVYEDGNDDACDEATRVGRVTTTGLGSEEMTWSYGFGEVYAAR